MSLLSSLLFKIGRSWFIASLLTLAVSGEFCSELALNFCPSDKSFKDDYQSIDCVGDCDVDDCCTSFCNSFSCDSGYTHKQSADDIECSSDGCTQTDCCDQLCSSADFTPGCVGEYQRKPGNPADIQCIGGSCDANQCCDKITCSNNDGQGYGFSQFGYSCQDAPRIDNQECYGPCSESLCCPQDPTCDNSFDMMSGCDAGTQPNLAQMADLDCQNDQCTKSECCFQYTCAENDGRNLIEMVMSLMQQNDQDYYMEQMAKFQNGFDCPAIGKIAKDNFASIYCTGANGCTATECCVSDNANGAAEISTEQPDDDVGSNLITSVAPVTNNNNGNTAVINDNQETTVSPGQQATLAGLDGGDAVTIVPDASFSTNTVATSVSAPTAMIIVGVVAGLLLVAGLLYRYRMQTSKSQEESQDIELETVTVVQTENNDDNAEEKAEEKQEENEEEQEQKSGTKDQGSATAEVEQKKGTKDQEEVKEEDIKVDVDI